MAHFDLKITNMSKQTMTDRLNSNCDRYPIIATNSATFKFVHINFHILAGLVEEELQPFADPVSGVATELEF